MTVPSFSAGYDALLAPTAALLAPGDVEVMPIDWDPSQEFNPPSEEGSVYARVRVRFAGGGHASIGTRLFDTRGILSVAIIGNMRDGLSTITGYATNLLNAYRGANVSGLFFRNMYISGDGNADEAGWSQRTMVTDFEFTELLPAT